MDSLFQEDHAMTAQQPDLRQRDRRIAKLLGWCVVPVEHLSHAYFHILAPDGSVVGGTSPPLA